MRRKQLKRNAAGLTTICNSSSTNKRKKIKDKSSSEKTTAAVLDIGQLNYENELFTSESSEKVKEEIKFLRPVVENNGSVSNNLYLNQASPGVDRSTTEIDPKKSLIEDAIKFLIMKEPKLKPVIERNPCHLFSPEGLAQEIDPFEALTCSIISQQVSGAAAKSIKNRFIALFNQEDQKINPNIDNNFFPSASQICDVTTEILRTAGLSRRKAEYLKGLAEKFNTGELDTAMLLSAPYSEVYDALIKVRGLGKWSIEMFACFGLKKTDVFSTQDLGVQRGIAALMGRDINKLKKKGGKWKYMSEEEMKEISNKFKPYRYLLDSFIYFNEKCSLFENAKEELT